MRFANPRFGTTAGQGARLTELNKGRLPANACANPLNTPAPNDCAANAHFLID
jgi:hypothetical protein